MARRLLLTLASLAAYWALGWTESSFWESGISSLSSRLLEELSSAPSMMSLFEFILSDNVDPAADGQDTLREDQTTALASAVVNDMHSGCTMMQTYY
eukprot:5814796-Amphidinium_carterae.1